MNLFVKIATLLAFASHAYAQGDFLWEITPEDGFPIIAFDSANADSEVVFKYNFTGTLDANKYLGAVLYEADCVTPAGVALSLVDSLAGNELQLDIDIDQATISGPGGAGLYSEPTATTAEISFCARVDYFYKDAGGEVMSINFHETVVVISVDLTANFTLTGISTDRTAADEDTANAELDYPIHAYFCNNDNTETTPGAFVQGSALQVCVEIDSGVTEQVYVDDILQFVVSQPLGPATPSTNIAGGFPDPLTSKVCATGVCNVMTQLPSKYFVNPSPNDLQIDGMALLAFGSPARMLRARISGSIAAAPSAEMDRQLQVAEGGENPFSLQVGLVSAQTAAPVAAQAAPASGNDNMMLMAAILVVLILIVVVLLTFMIFYCVKSGKKNTATY